MFKQVSAEDLKKSMLLEAQRLAVQYQAEAEKAAAEAISCQTMADMYSERAKRLQAEISAK